MTVQFTRPDDWSVADGTFYAGNITTTYAELTEVFGPDEGPSGDEKTQAEWTILFEDGTVATIYDWKEYGTPVEEVTDWHIGGRSSRAVDLVQAVLTAVRDVEQMRSKLNPKL